MVVFVDGKGGGLRKRKGEMGEMGEVGECKTLRSDTLHNVSSSPRDQGQDTQCTHNVTMRCVHEKIVAVKKQ